MTNDRTYISNLTLLRETVVVFKYEAIRWKMLSDVFPLIEWCQPSAIHNTALGCKFYQEQLEEKQITMQIWHFDT